MFGSIGGTELLLIMVVALLVFGPRKLPQLGRRIGKAMGEFRRASHDFRSSLESEIDAEETPTPPGIAPAPVSSTDPTTPAAPTTSTPSTTPPSSTEPPSTTKKQGE